MANAENVSSGSMRSWMHVESSNYNATASKDLEAFEEVVFSGMFYSLAGGKKEVFRWLFGKDPRSPVACLVREQFLRSTGWSIASRRAMTDAWRIACNGSNPGSFSAT